MKPSIASVLAVAVSAVPAVVWAASPTSDVEGIAFDRIIQIWLENTNFDIAARDPNLQWVASKGILLTNYFAVSHPSQPNYAAVAAGDNFGMDSGDFLAFPENVSTVVDLLDTKGISWAEYQEGLPYPGFPGLNYSNQQTFANNYVRKHNPLIQFDSVAKNQSRVVQIKGFDGFVEDLSRGKLPQWAFITPNMTNNAHDTNITFAGSWTRRFLEPLLANEYFTNNTLIVLSFDECEIYPRQNRVFTVLLGGAVPDSLHGTVDETFYNHYSTISTVSANWGLPSLGRWDCGANIFSLVAQKTGYQNAAIDVASFYFNTSFPGPMSNSRYTPGWWPAPNTKARCAAGRGVLRSVAETWGDVTGTYNYTNVYPYDSSSGVNAGGRTVIGANDANVTSSGSGSPLQTAPRNNNSNVASGQRPSSLLVLGIFGFAIAFLR